VKKKVLIGIVTAAAFIALLTYMSLGMRQHRVEVCVEFQGRKNCRTAAGPTKEQALRTATENACGLIASGMTDSMACSQTPPVSVKYLE
jgi:hypothetical protein